MGKEYIVQSAVCMCKFGAAPGILKVTDNKGVYMNGKLAATTMTLGNVFNPPGFGVCKINPMFPKPCTPAVTQWIDHYDGASINGNSYPLTETSKGTCATGCPGCITFQTTGQIAVPGMAQMKQAAAAHQNDINPMGVAEGLDENAKDDTPILVRVYWRDKDGNEIEEFQNDESITLCADVENVSNGDKVNFQITNGDGKRTVLKGAVLENRVEINVDNIDKLFE